MTQKEYAERRAQLIRDLFFFREKKHFPRCANARIRAIAKLDYEYDGTPIKETYKLFNYQP